MTAQTILVIPGDGTDPIPCLVVRIENDVYLIDDGENYWTVRASDIRDGRVPGRLVFLAAKETR